MKITPIEIRQHTFERGMRGYKQEEVDAFMSSLSQEWERVASENRMLRMQLEIAEKELGKLKEVEMTLFRTLKNAEDTSVQIAEQATRAGDLHVAEARKQADSTLAEARKKAAMLVQDAESQSRFLRDSILGDVRAIEQDFRAMEKYKETLMNQIRTLASNAVDSVERFEKKFNKHAVPDKLNDVLAQINPTPAPAVEPARPIVVTVAPVPVSPEEPTLADIEPQPNGLAPHDEPTELLPVDSVMSVVDDVPAVEPAHELAEAAHSIAEAEPTGISEPAKATGSFFDQF